MDPTESRYNTWEWRSLAAIAKHRAGGRCETCGTEGPLDAHHIRPVGEGGPFWDLDNLRALCRNCHQRQHPGWVDDDEVNAALREWMAEGDMVRLVQIAAIEHKLYEAAQAEVSRLSTEVSELRDENVRLRAERSRLTTAHAQGNTTLTSQTTIEANWEGNTVERQRAASRLASRWRTDETARKRLAADCTRRRHRWHEWAWAVAVLLVGAAIAIKWTIFGV